MTVTEIIDYVFSKAYELLFMGILLIEVFYVFVWSPRAERRQQERLERWVLGVDEEKEEKKKKKESSEKP